jgi:hypothetical protein
MSMKGKGETDHTSQASQAQADIVCTISFVFMKTEPLFAGMQIEHARGSDPCREIGVPEAAIVPTMQAAAQEQSRSPI